jgi:outer membrane protein assembly factor BamB
LFSKFIIFISYDYKLIIVVFRLLQTLAVCTFILYFKMERMVFKIKKEKKLKMQKNKVLSIIALVVLLTSLFMTTIGSIKADSITPSAFLSVNPNPVGVNQPVDVTIWLAPITVSQDDVFHGFSVTITKPDGTTETKGPLTAYAMGTQFFSYTPTMVGDYLLKFDYPGETFVSAGDDFLPASSAVATLVVQDDPIPWWPENPIPNDYWERPINSQNRNWASISGNWLMVGYNATYLEAMESCGAYNPYTTAPRSSHIMWTESLGIGGLTGGESGSRAYYTGQSYDTHVVPPIIMGGRLIYRKYRTNFGDQMAWKGVICQDLRTGEELWTNDEADIVFGQDWYYNTPNGFGVIPLLWDTAGSTWHVYDPTYGELLYSFENALSADNKQIYFGEDGVLYTYHLDGRNDWLVMWNQSKCFDSTFYYSFTPEVAGLGNYYPYKGTFDWRTGIEWNVTIPHHEGTGRSTNPSGISYPSIYHIASDLVLARIPARHNSFVGWDMNTGAERLFVTAEDTNPPQVAYPPPTGDGVYALFNLQTMRWTGWSLNTGTKLWESDPQEYPWGSYMNYSPLIANGKLFSGAWDGYMHVFDVNTGEELWKFYSGDSGRETIFGTWPFWNGPILADGVVFAATGEETPTQPLSRGGRMFAIDEETGEEIWSLNGYMGLRAIADGYLITYNAYDNLIYCFGKGPSATTVTAPKTQVMQGEKLVIEGTVTDQSAGAMGTPAISDEDMSDWMEYMYMQQSMPINANGNFRNIGTATSDMSGVYSLVWEPDIPGKYTVVATFAGSESYGSSFAQTNFYVEEAPAPTSPPQETPAPMTDTYVLGMGAAALIGIIVIGFVLILMMRKK